MIPTRGEFYYSTGFRGEDSWKACTILQFLMTPNGVCAVVVSDSNPEPRMAKLSEIRIETTSFTPPERNPGEN